MRLVKKYGLYASNRVVYLAPEEIAPNGSSSRRTADPGSLRELAASIVKYGILQPLTVRRRGGAYELISGERRLSAAILAGLTSLPCIVLDVGEETSAALALVENLQRRELGFVEEAAAIGSLREQYGYSQEETARLIGRSQSAVANKLRLLRLPRELLFAVRDAGLSERHARALLRLPTEREQAAALSRMIADELTVARAEELVERMLSCERDKPDAPEEPAPAKPREPSILVRDPRFFVNSIERGAEIMRRNGIRVELACEDGEREIVITVKIHKRAQ